MCRLNIHTRLLQLAAQRLRKRLHRPSPSDADVSAGAHNHVARVITNNDVHRARVLVGRCDITQKHLDIIGSTVVLYTFSVPIAWMNLERFASLSYLLPLLALT